VRPGYRPAGAPPLSLSALSGKIAAERFDIAKESATVDDRAFVAVRRKRALLHPRASLVKRGEYTPNHSIGDFIARSLPQGIRGPLVGRESLAILPLEPFNIKAALDEGVMRGQIIGLVGEPIVAREIERLVRFQLIEAGMSATCKF
jgi:hypothetical protein